MFATMTDRAKAELLAAYFGVQAQFLYTAFGVEALVALAGVALKACAGLPTHGPVDVRVVTAARAALAAWAAGLQGVTIETKMPGGGS